MHFMLTRYAVCVIFPALVFAEHNALLPRPQQVRYGPGKLGLDRLTIAVAGAPAAEDYAAAQMLSAELSRIRGRSVPIRQASGGEERPIVLRRDGPVAPLPERDERPGRDSREAYTLRVTPAAAEVRARSSAGLYYGAETLVQMVEGSGPGAAIPEAEVEDWPALPYRGVMMDVSHGALPTEQEIRRQIDFLSRWKGNQYYLYSELSIELKGYALINPGARYTQEQIRRIVDYARERHVDVLPCLEFYGHLHDLFRLERYADLSPLPHGGEIVPTKPEIQRMMADWVAQMAGLFPSPWFHIGLDEPGDLVRAGSAAAGGAAPRQLYLDHLERMAALLRGHGKRTLFWADVASGAAIFERYPELASKLPPETIPVVWHYNAQKDYTRMLAPFSKAGVPQVIGTGIWGWDRISPDFLLTFANIDGFVADARKHGAIGMINTNWADDAQLMYRSTLPGIAYGAAAAWQSGPVDRKNFFAEYAARFYGERGAADAAAALDALARAEQSISAALGPEDMFRLWDDPFAPDVLERARTHAQDLRNARLLAEEAQERLMECNDGYSVPSLLLAARLLDYAGQKYLYAIEIADVFQKVGPGASRADVSFWLGRQAGDRNHSRIGDLMDTISELREVYRQAWDAEYEPYRRAAALGRFDAEYEYWRRLQARLWEVRRTFRNGGSVPTIESLRVR